MSNMCLRGGIREASVVQAIEMASLVDVSMLNSLTIVYNNQITTKLIQIQFHFKHCHHSLILYICRIILTSYRSSKKSKNIHFYHYAELKDWILRLKSQLMRQLGHWVCKYPKTHATITNCIRVFVAEQQWTPWFTALSKQLKLWL
jgi:hypothetical protein